MRFSQKWSKIRGTKFKRTLFGDNNFIFRLARNFHVVKSLLTFKIALNEKKYFFYKKVRYCLSGSSLITVCILIS